jgi:hypothetical protein
MELLYILGWAYVIGWYAFGVAGSVIFYRSAGEIERWAWVCLLTGWVGGPLWFLIAVAFKTQQDDPAGDG